MYICDPNGRLMTFCRQLIKFHFQVVYKKGIQNNQADALFRLLTLGETTIPTDEDIPCFTAEEDDLEPQGECNEDKETDW